MKISQLILALSLLIQASGAFAMTTSLLSFDNTENKKDALPSNFRSLSSLQINAIASGQFSAAQLLEVRKKYPHDKITIVDLRRENHGLINGDAVIWHTVFEKGNVDKTVTEILSDEKKLLKLAQENQQIVVNKILQRDRANGWFKETAPQIVSVKNAISEENLAQENGFQYKRFAIRDLDRPSATEFAQMVDFIKKLAADQKIYVHCAGGYGRTGTFLVMLDIIKNGKNSSLKEIIARQHKLGAAQLDDISEDEAWSKEIAQERLKMLQDLYYSNK